MHVLPKVIYGAFPRLGVPLRGSLEKGLSGFVFWPQFAETGIWLMEQKMDQDEGI